MNNVFDDLGFEHTNIVIKLVQLQEKHLISRSQAKHVLRGIETRFTHVTLDFTGVTLVGQGFVDEIFRVYQNQYPHITFHTINANDDINFMIERGIAIANR